MLTRFFSKSKPVNFLVVAICMAIFFIAVNFSSFFSDFQILGFVGKLVVLALFVLSISVLDFIARKNDLTKRSAFKMLFFAVFSLSFLAILKNFEIIIANFCVLLALRRIISLKSLKDVRKKIFDATFWICIASLFYFWAILFLIIVYAGILLHTSTYFKNWLIPLIGIFTVFLLVMGFHIGFYNEIYHFNPWYENSFFGFKNYKDLKILIPLIIVAAISLWSLFFYLGLMQKASIRSRPTYILVLLTLLIAVAAAVLAPKKNGSELLFMFVPLAIIVSNFFDKKGQKPVKEILLAVFILMPFILLALP